MTDVELLREYAGFSGTPVEMRAVLLSSADHIEKLEAALAHIYAWYPVSVSDPAKTIRDIREFAHKALEGEDD